MSDSSSLPRRALLGGVLEAFRARVPAPRPPPRPPRKARPAPPPLPPIPLRPPGALPEAEFRATCEGCKACVEACPPGALVPLGEAYTGVEGTPGLFPAARACTMCADLPCVAACPSGALESGTTWARARLGVAVIEGDACLDIQGTPCDLCALACPAAVRAIRLTAGGPEVLRDRCTGCGLCVESCPAEPVAIRVALLPEPPPSP